MSDHDKPLKWVGSSLADLTAFPKGAKDIAGHQIRRVQQGRDPDHWRPMAGVGPGVKEIIIETGDAFRVFFVAKFEEAVYVLHAFQKTTQQTQKRDIELGTKRYRDVVREQDIASATARKGRAQNK